MNSPSNPLLDFSGLPRFDEILPDHVGPAIDALLEVGRRAVEAVALPDTPPTWETVIEPLAGSLDRLDRMWGAVRHLNAVVNTPAMRDAYNAALPDVIAFHADLSQDQRLYDKYRALRAQPEYASLDATRRQLIDNELRDFRLGGAELDAAGKARFKAMQEELADLSTQFDEHVLDATNAWALHITDASELAGVPQDVLSAASAAAKADGKEGWKLSLRMPGYLPVLQYARNRNLRRRMHEAYATRASELGARAEWDNTAIIDRILALRHEEALLLGYRNYAEVSLVPKMAGDPAEVIAFLRDLAQRARPFAQRDFAELAAFA